MSDEYERFYPTLSTGSDHGSTEKPIRSRPVGFKPPPPKVELPSPRCGRKEK